MDGGCTFNRQVSIDFDKYYSSGVIFLQINNYILGIFTMLGNIKLMGMSDRLFNFQNGTEQKSPIAIFTHDLDPEERKTQFAKQFLEPFLNHLDLKISNNSVKQNHVST